MAADMSSEEPTAERDDEALRKALEFDAVEEIHRIRAGQRRLERVTLALTWTFVVVVIGAIFFMQRENVGVAVRALDRLSRGGIEVDLNCADPQHSTKQICLDRKARQASDWRGIVRNEGGQQNPYAVHGRD